MLITGFAAQYEEIWAAPHDTHQFVSVQNVHPILNLGIRVFQLGDAEHSETLTLVPFPVNKMADHGHHDWRDCWESGEPKRAVVIDDLPHEIAVIVLASSGA